MFPPKRGAMETEQKSDLSNISRTQPPSPSPGDEVLVGPGIYREYVDPANAGTPEAPITYRSVEPLGAVITGAEEIKSWEPYEGNVRKTHVPNSLFGTYNPYTTYVYGDWYFAGRSKHTGCVYL